MQRPTDPGKLTTIQTYLARYLRGGPIKNARLVAYDGARRVVRSGAAREGAVTALAWGLRGKRRAEIGAENVRLTSGDLLAEARARVGEQAPPPSAADVHDHTH
mgnify:CR=1 FL=1